jgi:hypothetical protein
LIVQDGSKHKSVFFVRWGASRKNFFLAGESGGLRRSVTAKPSNRRQREDRAVERQYRDERCGVHECWMKSMMFGECTAATMRQASDGRTHGKRLEMVNY